MGSISGGNNLIGGNPLLGPLGDYGGPTLTMPLLPGSPAIGAGTTAAAPATDQRGEPRSGHVDGGAFQSQGFTLTPVAGSTPQSAGWQRRSGTRWRSRWLRPTRSSRSMAGWSISLRRSAGASATLSAATVIIADGQAAVTATADTTSGAYTVTALVPGRRLRPASR